MRVFFFATYLSFYFAIKDALIEYILMFRLNILNIFYLIKVVVVVVVVEKHTITEISDFINDHFYYILL